MVATDRDAEGLRAAAEAEGWPHGVATQALDVRDAEAWGEALDLADERFGGVDVLFHVAGFLRPGYVLDQPADAADLHLDVNARGVMLGTRLALPRMLGRAGAHVLVVGSLAGIAPIPGIALYSASKFAVRGYTLALAEELRAHGVAVTLISPDAVQTPMLDLQVGEESAAMTFSGPRPLTVSEIETAVFARALVERPVELVLPAHRGWLARLGGAVPGIARPLLPAMRAVGRLRQRRLRRPAG